MANSAATANQQATKTNAASSTGSARIYRFNRQTDPFEEGFDDESYERMMNMAINLYQSTAKR